MPIKKSEEEKTEEKSSSGEPLKTSKSQETKEESSAKTSSEADASEEKKLDKESVFSQQIQEEKPKVNAEIPHSGASEDSPPNSWEKKEVTVRTSHPFENLPVIPEESNGKRLIKIFIVFVVVFLLAVSGYFGFQYFRETQSKPSEKGASPIIQKDSPTPTPTPELARKILIIQVLNGSGEKGAANIVKSFLEERGYTVQKTGNADNFGYKETIIQLKEDKKAYFDLLSEDLSENYEVSSEAGELDEDTEYDAAIIVGKSTK